MFVDMKSYDRFFLLLAVGLASSLVLTSAQSSTLATGCQTAPIWSISNNTNVGGGQQQPSSVNTPALCQAACLANLNCVGADFNSFDSSCWLSISGSVGTRNNGTASGIIRFDLISRGSPSACPAATSSQAPPCTNTWTFSANTNYAGGTGLPAVSSLADCQAACVATAACVAIDFNPNASPQCYWLSTLSGTKFSGQSSGISHYDLTRCVVATTTTTTVTASTSTTAASAAASASINAVPCSNTWTVSVNTNYAGGTGLPTATSLTACQDICAATAACVAVDFNPNASPQCYWLSTLSGTKFSGQSSGINNYVINRCVTTTTTQASTPCSYSWAFSPNTNYAGGNGLASATTIAACQAACIAAPTCVAIDFNPSGSPQCYWLTSLSGAKFSGQSSGISHYDLTRSCSGSSPTYTIINHKYGGFVSIDPMTLNLLVVDDFNKATWFSTTTPCLAASIAGFTSTANCVSWSPVDWPGYYVRDMQGTLVVQQQSGQAFPIRFSQDASFYTSNDSFGYVTVQPVTSQSNTYYYIRGCDDSIKSAPFNSSWMYTDSATFFPMTFAVPSSTPDTASCMLTWTRTNGARGPLKVNKGLQTLADCRKLCIMFTNCTGVSYNYEWSYCFLETIASSNSPLVAAPMFVYFDLIVFFSGKCSSGCRSTWQSKNQYLTNYLAYTINASVHDCRHSCIDDGMCIGINWVTSNGVNNCTKYYTVPNIDWRNVMPSRSSYGCCNQWNESGMKMPGGQGTNSSGMNGGMNGMNGVQLLNGTVNFYAVTKSFSQCGSCTPRYQVIPGVIDPSGVLQAGVNDRASCRTGCINERKCTGFDMVNTTLCYFSLTPKPLLINSPFGVHVDLTRNPCGNGCQDKWDFYADTSATGLTARNYATEIECRQACQADATCNVFNWNYVTNSCFWGSGNNVRNMEGTSIGWNHYELFTQPFCDDD